MEYVTIYEMNVNVIVTMKTRPQDRRCRPRK